MWWRELHSIVILTVVVSAGGETCGFNVTWGYRNVAQESGAIMRVSLNKDVFSGTTLVAAYVLSKQSRSQAEQAQQNFNSFSLTSSFTLITGVPVDNLDYNTGVYRAVTDVELVKEGYIVEALSVTSITPYIQSSLIAEIVPFTGDSSNQPISCYNSDGTHRLIYPNDRPTSSSEPPPSGGNTDIPDRRPPSDRPNTLITSQTDPPTTSHDPSGAKIRGNETPTFGPLPSSGNPDLPDKRLPSERPNTLITSQTDLPTTTRDPSDAKSRGNETPTWVYIIVALLIVVVIILASLVAVCIWKKKSKPNGSPTPQVNYTNQTNGGKVNMTPQLPHQYQRPEPATGRSDRENDYRSYTDLRPVDYPQQGYNYPSGYLGPGYHPPMMDHSQWRGSDTPQQSYDSAVIPDTQPSAPNQEDCSAETEHYYTEVH